MMKKVLEGIGAALLLAAAVVPVRAASPEQEQAVLAEAEKLLAEDAEKPVDVPACGALADRIGAISGPETDLARVQVIARCLSGIDYENREQPAIAQWIHKLGDDVIFSEPSGQYYVARERIWDLYERFKTHPLAEPMAWEAAKTPAGGECEGYLNCYLSDSLESLGRYLELYPRGKHSAAALEELYWLQEEPSGVEPLDRADVANAKRLFGRWRQILAAVEGGQNYVKGLDRLAAAYKVR